jgi:hypothetical protein
MKRFFFLVLLLLAQGVALSADADTAPKVVTISLNEDVISFVKGTVWFGGIFLAIFAFIGIAFFGWDVRKARASIVEAQKEIRENLAEMRKDYAALKEMKEQLEQTGAQLQEDSEKEPPPPVQATASRSNLDLIREVLRTSRYTWTTLGRLVKRTGLDRDTILQEARSASDIVISFGKQSNDHIFRFKTEG